MSEVERAERHFNRLVAKRQAVRKQAQTAAAELAAATAEPLSDEYTENVEIQVEKTQLFADQLPALDSEIFELTTEDDKTTSEANEVAEFQNEIYGAVKAATIRLRRLKTQSDQQNGSIIQSCASSLVSAGEGAIRRVMAKLPKLEIKPFGGKTTEFQEFWDSFNSMIHENDEITDIDKMQYLKNLLTDKAKDAVQGYRPTADNYPIVYKLLVERFGNPETAKFMHFEQLFALKPADNDSVTFSTVYNECERHIRSLVALGMTEDTFGPVFVPLILSKLPRATVLHFHRSKGDQDWDLATLRYLMKREIQARELSNRFFQPNQGGPQTQTSGGGGRSGQQGNSKHGSQYSRGGGQNQKGGKIPWTSGSSLITSSGESKVKCCFCGEYHFADKCTKFKSLEERKKALGERCYACLDGSHISAECKRKRPCFFCKGHNHHSSLCPKQFGSGSKPEESKRQSKLEQTDIANEDQTPAKLAMVQTVMMMAVVEFPNAIKAQVLLDDASSTSYVSSRLSSKIGLVGTDEIFVSVGRFGSRKREQRSLKTTQLGLPLKGSGVLPIVAYVTDVITCPIQKHAIDLEKYPILRHLPLADPPSSKTEMVEIDILLGGDYCHSLTTGEKIAVGGGLYLYGSDLGYISAGTTPQQGHSRQTETTAVTLFVQDHVQNSKYDIDRFWSLEDIGIFDDPVQNENDHALELFKDSIRKVDGRYEVRLPWREENPELNSNFGLAKGRLQSLFHKLKGQPALMDEYDQILADQLKSGIIERVNKSNPSDRVHYIPHHCVVKPSSATTKIRIVYDASAKSAKNSLSLNDCLLRGPIAIQDICGLLFRFRISDIAFVCDIAKAFRQIRINPVDRDVLRFLWLKDLGSPPTNFKLVTLRFARLPFGMVSSPFLLDGTIKHHLAQKGGATPRKIIQNLYVDNVLGGSQTVSQALAFYKDAKGLLAEIGMNLREWYSNSKKFFASVPPEDKGILENPKVLCLSWRTDEDKLLCGGLRASDCRTKRQFLSAVASVFDPCGFFSAVIVQSKFLIQEMWKQNISWDKPVPDAMATLIEDQIPELAGIGEIGLNRKVNKYVSVVDAIHEIHYFCDASARAYAAAVYLRSTTPEGNASIGLLFAKARLAPTKKITIPRLELMAAVIGARVAKFVQREIDLEISETVIWSDSKCVLHWLVTDRSLKVFVRNRVTELRKAESLHFRYVPTACNPADIPTKGSSTGDLKNNDLWWHGPSFLTLSSEMWPENIQTPQSQLAETEYSKFIPLQTLTNSNDPEPCSIANIIDCKRFSSWSKLLRVTATVLRASYRWKQLIGKGEQAASDADSRILRAEREWIIDAQSAGCANGQETGVQALGLYEDDQGIVRCRGRHELSD